MSLLNCQCNSDMCVTCVMGVVIAWAFLFFQSVTAFVVPDLGRCGVHQENNKTLMPLLALFIAFSLIRKDRSTKDAIRIKDFSFVESWAIWKVCQPP